jgi:hypothetical protein
LAVAGIGGHGATWSTMGLGKPPLMFFNTGTPSGE